MHCRIYIYTNLYPIANNKYKKEWNEAFDFAIEALQREEAEEKGYCHRIMPSNVEVVVRCRDCKHWQKTDIETIDGYPVYDCPFCGEWADANGFCSFGERRE